MTNQSSLWKLKRQELYGGAMSFSCPSTFLDASTFRQVPDHQEVFIDRAATDQSLIIELLQLDEDLYAKTNDHISGLASKYHFEQLAEDNGSTQMLILHQENVVLPKWSAAFPDSTAQVLVGFQAVPKFNAKVSTPIYVFLGLIRIPTLKSDLLMTFNTPPLQEWQLPQVSLSSSSPTNIPVAQGAPSPAHSNNGNGNVTIHSLPMEILKNFYDVFVDIFKSLELHDVSLFDSTVA